MSLPIPNLDDKTFQELFEEARALIPRFDREWTDHNFSDPGITLIDLFAWLAEMQIYSLNRINDVHIIKFMQLLDERPCPAQPAKAGLLFVNTSLVKPCVEISAGTTVASADPETGEPLIFETETPINAVALSLARILSEDEGVLLDNTESNATESVFFFAFGLQPQKDDKLYLGFSAEVAFPTCDIKLAITPYEADLPARNDLPGVTGDFVVMPSAQLNWQYWDGNNWTQMPVVDGTDALTRLGTVTFTGPEDIQPAGTAEIFISPMANGEKKFYWIRAVVQEAAYEIPPRIALLQLNTVSATQGKTIAYEFHESTGLPYQHLEANDKPILANTLLLEVLEEDQQWHEWLEAPDFDHSGPNDRHYLLDAEAGLIQFGDDMRGRIPPVVASANGNIRLTKYRAGGGPKGNVRADTIRGLTDPNIQCVAVTNPKPAFGGQAAEELAEAGNRARRSLKDPTRTVTSDDFERLARETPGLRIARAAVLPHYHPLYPCIDMPGAVTVVVVPYILPATHPFVPIPSAGFLQTVKKHLYVLRLVTTNLHVIAPVFVEIRVTADVGIKPRTSANLAREKIAQALDDFLNPTYGGVDKTGWPFGRPVYKSEIYQAIGAVPGVSCVNRVTIAANGPFRQENGNIALTKIGLVYPGEHEITINGQ